MQLHAALPRGRTPLRFCATREFAYLVHQLAQLFESGLRLRRS